MQNKNLKWTDNCKIINWQELSNLYKIAPLGDKPVEMLKISFPNSRFTFFVYDNDKLIGVGRAEYEIILLYKKSLYLQIILSAFSVITVNKNSYKGKKCTQQ